MSSDIAPLYVLTERESRFTDVSGGANRHDAVGRAGRLVPRQSCRFDVRVRTRDAGTPKNREFTGACNCFPQSVFGPGPNVAVSKDDLICLSVLEPHVHIALHACVCADCSTPAYSTVEEGVMGSLGINDGICEGVRAHSHVNRVRTHQPSKINNRTAKDLSNSCCGRP